MSSGQQPKTCRYLDGRRSKATQPRAFHFQYNLNEVWAATVVPSCHLVECESYFQKWVCYFSSAVSWIILIGNHTSLCPRTLPRTSFYLNLDWVSFSFYSELRIHRLWIINGKRMLGSWNLFRSDGGIELVPEISLIIVQQLVGQSPNAVKSLLLLSKVNLFALLTAYSNWQCYHAVVPLSAQTIWKINHPQPLVQWRRPGMHQHATTHNSFIRRNRQRNSYSAIFSLVLRAHASKQHYQFPYEPWNHTYGGFYERLANFRCSKGRAASTLGHVQKESSSTFIPACMWWWHGLKDWLY